MDGASFNGRKIIVRMYDNRERERIKDGERDFRG